MSLEGVVENGVIVPDPSAEPLPDGTRVQFAPRRSGYSSAPTGRFYQPRP